MLCCAEALLAGILAPPDTPPPAPAQPGGSPWTAVPGPFGAGAALTSPSAPGGVLQGQSSFEDLQRVAGQVQQLLMGGHVPEALRQRPACRCLVHKCNLFLGSILTTCCYIPSCCRFILLRTC